jgi:putative drug exporter of the RND superfamily
VPPPAAARRRAVRRVFGRVGQAWRGLGRGYRSAVVAARWPVLLLWFGAALVVTVFLPAPSVGGGGVGSLLPADSPALAVAQRSLAEFPVPVESQTVVVVEQPGGLSPLTRADVVLYALGYVQAAVDGDAPAGPGHVLAAIPVPTSTPDVAVTYLFTSGGTSAQGAAAAAQQYAAHFRNQPGVRTYVTGLVPAQARQGVYAAARLPVFEVGTFALIALIVGIVFRSLVAPLVVFVAAGIGFLVAIRALGVLAASFGFSLPAEFTPVLGALLIGVITDYCVLLFSGLRAQLDRGLPRLEAARGAFATQGPIIAVAGITVAGGTGALLAANFQLFRQLGPALALTVVLGVLISLTLVPAMLAVLGRWTFAPGGLRPSTRPGGRRAGPLLRAVVHRRGAAVAVVLCVGALAVAAVPVLHLRMGLSFTSVLPADDPVRQGAALLRDSGIRGVVAPTEVLVEGDGVTRQRAALERLQAAVAAEPGVAAVIGPAQNPLPERFGVLFSRAGDAARLVVILDSDPLSAPAIADLDRLTGRLDGLAAASGIHGATVSVTGQTAIAAELTAITLENLRIVLVAALLVELVILVVFLRALLAPVVLLLCSALSVAAALGLTVAFFQDVRGDPDLTFYAPFATAVLLLALGSDYNVFAIGSIWDAAARHPLREAITRAMPATSRAIGAAGLILAGTFAMVAVMPLETIREIAFTMSVGLLLDTFLVRPVLTPAVLILLGRWAGWPSRRIRTEGPPGGAPVAPGTGPPRTRPRAGLAVATGGRPEGKV